MQITFELPDRLAAHLVLEGQEPGRAALEALALEGYRTQRLSEFEVRQMLGFAVRSEVHAFLAAHEVPLHYSVDDLEVDATTASHLRLLRKAG